MLMLYQYEIFLFAVSISYWQTGVNCRIVKVVKWRRLLVEKAFIDLLDRNYNKVFNFTGSSTMEGGFSVALQYTLNGRTYSGLEHEAVVKKLKMPMPLGSIIHGYGNDPILLDKIAAKLIIDGNVDESISQLHKNIALLKEKGFSNGYNLNYSALFLKDEAHAERAKQFFREMKSNQRFLTRKSDYPITLLLTQQSVDVVQLADTIYEYYQALRQHQFKAGDQLQMLAQFLAFYSPTFEPKMVDYTVQLKKQVSQGSIRVTKNLYPLIGLLALNATDNKKLEEIFALKAAITAHKTFKHFSNLAFSAAVFKTLTDEKVEGAITHEQQLEWWDLVFYSDLFLVLPKALIESVLSVDFNIFQ